MAAGHERAKEGQAQVSAASTALHELEPNLPSSIAQETPLTTNLEQDAVRNVAENPQPTQGSQARTVNEDSRSSEGTARWHEAFAENESGAQNINKPIHKRFLKPVESETTHEQCQNIRDNGTAGMEEREQASGHRSLGLAQSDQAGLPLPSTGDQRLTSHKDCVDDGVLGYGEKTIGDQEPTRIEEAQLTASDDEDLVPRPRSDDSDLEKEDRPENGSAADEDYQECDIYADDEGLRQFEEVLETLDVTSLEQLALQLRQSQLRKSGNKAVVSSCEADPYPFHDTYNVVFVLRFDDGVEWIARVPGYGASPSALQIEKMDLEYRTMKYIRSKTIFKMPEVYYWSTSTNEVGTHFGLISLVEGVSLWECWQDIDFDEQKRMTAIAGVASEMAKLYPLQFDKTGMLRFDADGKASHVDYEIDPKTYITVRASSGGVLPDRGSGLRLYLD